MRRNTTAIARWAWPRPTPHKDTVDPEAWAIVDGKLYLTHTPRSLDAWRENAAEIIKTADENWPTVKNLPEPTIIGPPCPEQPQTVVVSLGGGKREVLIFGQVARDAGGNVVGKGDMRAQIEHVGKNIQACLNAAGANTSDIVLTRAYVTDTDAFLRNADMRARYLGPESRTSTAVKWTVSPVLISSSRWRRSPPSTESRSESRRRSASNESRPSCRPFEHVVAGLLCAELSGESLRASRKGARDACRVRARPGILACPSRHKRPQETGRISLAVASGATGEGAVHRPRRLRCNGRGNNTPSID